MSSTTHANIKISGADIPPIFDDKMWLKEIIDDMRENIDLSPIVEALENWINQIRGIAESIFIGTVNIIKTIDNAFKNLPDGVYFTLGITLSLAMKVIDPSFNFPDGTNLLVKTIITIPTVFFQRAIFLQNLQLNITFSAMSMRDFVVNTFNDISTFVRTNIVNISIGIRLAWQGFKSWVLGLPASWVLIRSVLYDLFMSIVNGVTELIRALFIRIGTALKKKITSAFVLKSLAVAAKLTATIVGAVAGLAILAGVTILINEIARLIKLLPGILGYAQGGFPEVGRPFIARESGAELVGILQTIQGRRTAVVNSEQIVEAVSIGVHNAFSAALRKNGSGRIGVARVFLNGKVIATSEQNLRPQFCASTV